MTPLQPFSTDAFMLSLDVLTVRVQAMSLQQTGKTAHAITQSLGALMREPSTMIPLQQSQQLAKTLSSAAPILPLKTLPRVRARDIFPCCAGVCYNAFNQLT